MPAANSEILDALAECASEILKQPPNLDGLIAARYFRQHDYLRLGFDFFLVRMEDDLARQAGSPESRWVERVTRMAALERERRTAKPPEGTRCVLCRCDAVAELHGFPVCEYHQTHGEDDPDCQECR